MLSFHEEVRIEVVGSGVIMRFFPLFVFVLWNLGVLCPIDAKGELKNSFKYPFV